jgi:uncharacterized metal-binding protein
MTEENDPTCHNCDSMSHCTVGRASTTLDNCPMKVSPEIYKEARRIYETNEFIKKSTNVASIVEAEGYIRNPRLKDTIEYALGMGYKKLGLIFCVGLLREAERIAEILKKYKFDVVSVCCKTGSFKKVDLGVPEEYTMMSKTGYRIGFVSCNPVCQALLVNKAETEMNILCGLCVGHDITFTHLSEAPVTTLIAKDRSAPHNPAAVLFSHYGNEFFTIDIQESRKKRKKASKK